MTRESEFYKRTVNHIKNQARDAASSHHFDEHPNFGAASEAILESRQQHQQAHDEHQSSQAPPPINDKLKARLREAEQLAKKSADDKYRALKSTDQEVERHKAEREIKGKTIAGRKTVPANGQQPLGTAAQGGSRGEGDDSVQVLYTEIMSHSPVIIFSKSYCPHSRKAKRILLHAFDISPKPYVVELDLHPHGPELQDLLEKKTGRRTVPNIMVGGQSAGGGDEMESLWRSGNMITRLTQMGGQHIDKVTQLTKYGEDGKA